MDLVFNNSTRDRSFDKSFFKKIIAIGLNELKIIDNISLSISLVDESEIQKLNKQYRNKDKVTDVLSFPMVKGGIKKLKTENWKPETIIDLGDIFICLPFAKKEAKRENINIDVKLTQLLAHGFLHLLGYDHERTCEEARKMQKLESDIFRKLELS